MPVRKARAGVLEDIYVTAQAASPSARVAYVDDDPLVLARSRMFRAPARGVAVSPADLTDPDSVLADLGLRAVIDLAQPACFIFGLTLNLVPATDARDMMAGYLRRAAPGSCVVISCGRCDDEALWRNLTRHTPPRRFTITRRPRSRVSLTASNLHLWGSSRRRVGGSACMRRPRRHPARCTSWPASPGSRPGKARSCSDAVRGLPSRATPCLAARLSLHEDSAPGRSCWRSSSGR
jgi:hypothetical protein